MIREACRMPAGLGPLPPVQTLFALILLLLMDLHVGEFAMDSFRRILERFTRDTEAALARRANVAAPAAPARSSVAVRVVSAAPPRTRPGGSLRQQAEPAPAPQLEPQPQSQPKPARSGSRSRHVGRPISLAWPAREGCAQPFPLPPAAVPKREKTAALAAQSRA
jgi:hypothetical protein